MKPLPGRMTEEGVRSRSSVHYNYHGIYPKQPNQSQNTNKMKSYYYDNLDGDQRLKHFNPSLPPVDKELLERIGVKYSFIPIDSDGNWEQVDTVRRRPV